MPFGCADYFRDVPGGMQVSANTFRAVCCGDMVCAFLDHGLERLLVFNGHTGNHALINETLREIRRERGGDRSVAEHLAPGAGLVTAPGTR